MALIPVKDIEETCLELLRDAGAREQDARIMFDHLFYNERAGKRSHGLLRLSGIIKHLRKEITSDHDPKMHLDLPSLGIVDGQGHIGIVAVHHGVDQAVSKARDSGIAFIGVRGYEGTTGTMHYHNKRIMEAGMIGIMGCNSIAMVCHPDGLDPVIGTNPISFAIPSKTTPYIADVTTSEWAYGRLRERDERGEPMPEGAMIDKDGNPSTDITDAFDGAMLPLSGYKGFSLGLAVELLAGPLIGAKAGHSEGPDGFFIIAIDPSNFGDRDTILRQHEAFLHSIKSGRKALDTKDILIPGERAIHEFDTVQGAHDIDIADSTWQTLQELYHDN